MKSSIPYLPDATWWRQVLVRHAILRPLKIVANTLGIAAFFVAYFWVMRHPQAAVTVMPLIAIDRWVAFEPAAMPLYVSLWVYVSIPLALVRTRRELWACGAATLAMSVIGMTIFLYFPTTVPEAGIDWSLHPSVAFLKGIDAGDNACPSLHVAFAVFAAVWLARILGEMRTGLAVRALNWLWCAGILYSTLATRQHVALDVLAGAALGLLVGVLHEHGLNRGPSAEARVHLVQQ